MTTHSVLVRSTMTDTDGEKVKLAASMEMDCRLKQHFDVSTAVLLIATDTLTKKWSTCVRGYDTAASCKQ